MELLRIAAPMSLVALLACGGGGTSSEEVEPATVQDEGRTLTATASPDDNSQAAPTAGRLKLIIDGVVTVVQDGGDIVLLLPDGQAPTDPLIASHRAQVLFSGASEHPGVEDTFFSCPNSQLKLPGLDLRGIDMKLDLSSLQVAPAPGVGYKEGLKLPHLGEVLREILGQTTDTSLLPGILGEPSQGLKSYLASRVRLVGVEPTDFWTLVEGTMRFHRDLDMPAEGKTHWIPVHVVLEKQVTGPLSLWTRPLYAGGVWDAQALAVLPGQTVEVIVENHPDNCNSGRKDFALHYQLMGERPSVELLPVDTDLPEVGPYDNAQCSPVRQEK